MSRLRQEGVQTGVAKCLDLDLCSLASVRQFAKEFAALGLPLHVLVNNGKVLCRSAPLETTRMESCFIRI